MKSLALDRTGHRLAEGDRVGSWRRLEPGTVVERATARPDLEVLRVLHDGDRLSTSYSIEAGRCPDLFLLNTRPEAVAA